jgi:MFS family permease
MSSPLRSPRRETKILGLIGTGHFLSHFYILTLPPLFPLIRADYGLSFVQLGLLMTVFNGMAAAAQVPVGLLVDRIGARAVLIAGLFLEAAAIGAMGLVPGYEGLLALALLAGLGHSVFHPADYSVLLATMDHNHMGRAFSIHTFMGSAGSALAPAVLIALTGLWNWRVAVMIVSLVGIAMAIALVSQMDALQSDRAPRARVSRRRKPGQPKPPTVGARVLLTPPVLVLFLFLFFLATTLPTSGIQTFSVAALMTLHDLPLATASSALTGYLVALAAGVLIGGVVADRTAKHDRIAVFAFVVTAAVLALVGEVRFEIVGLVALFALMGVLQGTVRPARDMMVREITPRGTAGTIFAFMSMGRLLGGTVSPLLFGWIIDMGWLFWLFWLFAVVMLAALGTLFMPRTKIA